MLEEYTRLHEQLLQDLKDYHNAHIEFLNSRMGRRGNDNMKKVLRRMRKTCKALHLELINLGKLRKEHYSNHYQEQRERHNESRNKNNSTTQDTV